MNDLSNAQSKILASIKQFINSNAKAPTQEELAQLNQVSIPTINQHLNKLELKSYIKRDRYRSRSIEIIETKIETSHEEAELIAVPILGEIAAGNPIMAEENFRGELWLDSRVTGMGKFFALEVKGESMIRCGIEPGCYVIVKQQSWANTGEIIAAMIDDSATVKRLKYEGDNVYLAPENDQFSDIDVTLREDFKILGKVVTWIKRKPKSNFNYMRA